jgi:hypothetical protein
MSYPLLPRHAPAPGIQQLDSHQDNAFQGLAEMMHFGLSHFVGRGLPSIWSSLSSDDSDIVPTARPPFTPNDLQVIRHWARKLDDWLVRYNGASRRFPQTSTTLTANFDQNPLRLIDRVSSSCFSIIYINYMFCQSTIRLAVLISVPRTSVLLRDMSCSFQHGQY